MKSDIAILGLGNLGKSVMHGFEAYATKHLSTVYVSKRLWTEKDNVLPAYAFKASNKEAIQKATYIFLCVKPYNVKELLNEIHPFLKEGQTIISCATGITLNEIKQFIPEGIDAYRAMPNTGASVKESITCLSSHPKNKNESQELFKMLSGLGESIEIDEKLMDAATVLGACGIAYVMRFIRGMVQGGIQIGFDAETASKIAYQTVKGAAELLIQNGNHPEAEIDKVTTPKGCTIEGLNEMEHAGFSSALIKGIVSSYRQLEE